MTASPFDLAGKTALVTGANTGIGQAIAVALAEAGVDVAVAGRSEPTETLAAIQATGRKAVNIAADFGSIEPVGRVVDEALAGLGRLDILVNNAGTTKHVPHDNMDGLTAEDFQRIYAVNTIGPFQMIRAARAQLEAGAKASGRATAVVNVSSVAGISGGGSSVAYAASKGALNTMTQSLARALAPLIRVNTVCPGYIDTPWFTKGRGEAGAKAVRDSVIAKVPLKTASTADDIAQLVTFLASPASGQMTGEFIRMDAGMHLIL